MTAVVAILAALYGRDRTGSGAYCDVAMTDVVFSWLSIHAAAFGATGEVPSPGTMPLTGAFPCYRVYPAADGHVAVGALEPRFWRALCERLDRPDLLGDAFATGARRAAVIAELSSLFATRTRAGWMEVLAGADTCVSPINDLSEAFADPQLIARDVVVRARAGDRAVAVPGDPLCISDVPAPAVRSAPGLGEHTDEILRDLGLSPDEVARLRAGGIV